mgnify:FL=1
MPNTDPIRLEDQICFQIYTANKKFNHFYQQILSKYDLTYPQYIALITLYEYAPLTVKQLGQYLNLDSGTLTPLLKRLENRGWINRKRSLQDERTVIISLTDKAKNEKQDMFEIVKCCISDLSLDSQDVSNCYGSLKQLSEKLDRYDQSRS